MLLIGFLFFNCFFISIYSCAQEKNNSPKKFTDSFGLDSCTFLTKGRNQFFILEPGYQLTLEGKEDRKQAKLVITVLNETKKIGNIETRVVEENESVNGQTVEISRNYFAFCKQTSSIFYFGEEVDNYKNGVISNHEGAWLAQEKNKPGLMMPGLILIGSRFYQEIAPGVAMDRAEIISTTENLKTPAGDFSNCLKTEETTSLSSKEKEYKIYAAGIGLIKDGNLLLVKYGFVKQASK
jgi:hypothetical protein